SHALCPLRPALPRRLALPGARGPRSALVRAEALLPALHLHLDADDAAAPPLRPADALRLEGPAAGGDHQRRRHGDSRGGPLMPIGTAKGFGVTFRKIFNRPITQ